MFADTDIARDILAKRYYAKGEIEPSDILERVSFAIASQEKEPEIWYSKFYDVMESGQFLPNSPCLVNAGRDGGLFACFVIGMDDNLASISAAKTQAMAITKAGGGWGIGLSGLRPAGSSVKGSTHGIAGGPVGFLSTFSSDMRIMTQGGFRDAACMATIDVHHPDIERFINAKTPINSIVEMLNLRKFAPNPEATAKRLLHDEAIALAAETYLSNFNMSVLVSDDFMEASLKGGGYSVGFGKDRHDHRDADRMLYMIAERAWANGEPGLLYIDTIRRRTKYEPRDIMATNPCGEQPLPPNGSCCLGSINLSEFVNEDGAFYIEGLRDTARIATRFLDNMITINRFPTPETREWSMHNRSIGIGVMGFADAMTKMGLRYDSREAVGFARHLAATIREAAEDESKNLYKEKGASSEQGSFNGRRNNAVMSIAPTGTISLLAGCSAGIEPPFSATTTRIDETGEHVIKHPLADYEAFVTVKDVAWEAIVDIVAAFSEHVDTSVSYTVNLPEHATVDDVVNVYRYAWEKGCNGCTVYRDKSRGRQVLNTTDNDDEEPITDKRPLVLGGATYKYTGRAGGESTNLYITVNDGPGGDPYEVFVNTPYLKEITELQLVTAVTRLTSLAIKYNVPVDQIIRQLRKVEGQSVGSIPLLIANALAEHTDTPNGICPECGGDIVQQGGCGTCQRCGYSHCG